MVIFGLDLASVNAGWAIYKDGAITNHGVWRINQRSRFTDLESKLNAAIKKYHVSSIAAEGIFKSDDKRLQCAYEILAKCHGVLQLVGERNGIPITLIKPYQAKRQMWGYSPSRHGRLTREQHKAAMIKAVTKYGYKLSTDRHGNYSDDEADAIGILITYLKSEQLPITHPATRNMTIIRR